MKNILSLALGLIVLATFLSLISGFIPAVAMVSEPNWNNDGRDCTLEACRIAAAGWPFPYIWDKDWTSPTNSADLFGALLDMDHFDMKVFIANTAFWLPVSILIIMFLKFIKRIQKKQN